MGLLRYARNDIKRARNDIAKGWYLICHCEERSEEAIWVVEGMDDGIASLRSQ